MSAEVYMAPEGYAELYEGDRGSLSASRDALVDARDSAMDFVSDYYTPPKEVPLVSGQMDKLLQEDSEYMELARARSREAREERGYLESGFTEGMGTLAAIDASYSTALSDVKVAADNASAANQLYNQQYINAWETASKTQVAQDEQVYKEFGYTLLTDAMSKSQDDYLELMGKGYEYAQYMQDLRHEQGMERDYLKFANETANRVMRNKTGLQLYYIDQYLDIMMSDIGQPQKFDQLTALQGHIVGATAAAVRRKDTQVEGQPFGIEGITGLEDYYIGKRTDVEFVWDMADADHTAKSSLKPVIDDITEQISIQCEDFSWDDCTPIWGLIEPYISYLNYNGPRPANFLDKMDYWDKYKYELNDMDVEEFFTRLNNIGGTTTEYVPLGETFIETPCDSDGAIRFDENSDLCHQSVDVVENTITHYNWDRYARELSMPKTVEMSYGPREEG